MCGIAGVLSSVPTTDDEMTAVVSKMADALRHRGPDAGGAWTDASAGVGLGFRRLSIIDLSPAGDQPMESADGRYVVTFNGEVYNFRDLRSGLEGDGVRFRGTSDTEVLVELIAAHGIDAALRRANGMFGLAVWDRARRVLSLARDRFGEKPLFYGWMGSTFLFGSELKALWRHPAFRFDVDRDSLALYLRYGYVPAPRSILRGVAKVRPGSSVEIDASRPGRVTDRGAYWSALEVAQTGILDPLTITEDAGIDHMDGLLRTSVAQRMIADVPLGAFLSGGIDSSTIVALMQAQSTAPVQTFTIGFEEFGFNEAGHAKAVASHLGTKHTELYLTAADALDVVPALPMMYDEPCADASQIPTHLVARLARNSVTVALSGDGGDEVFAGYNRHVYSRLHDRVRRVPTGVRRSVARMLAAVPAERWDRASERLGPLLPRRLRGSKAGDKVHKVARVLPIDDRHDLMQEVHSRWRDPSGVVIGGREPTAPLTAGRDWGALTDPTAQMQYLDTITYLPGDILTKVDRASMAVSLEARIPYLDPNVVAYAWRMPPEWRIRNRRGKWMLRRVLDRYVPEHLVLRPKTGFEMPVGKWLRGELRAWAEGLLSLDRLQSDQMLRPDVVRATWEEHASGHRDHKDALWAVLMFQAWHESARAQAGSRT